MQNTDDELIARSTHGDHAAYGELIDRYKHALFRHCFAIVRDEDDAKDIAQEALVKAYFKLHTYNNHYKFSTWLFKIATNLAFDHIKKHRRLSSLEDIPYEPVANGLSPHELATYNELHVIVAKLQPNYRSAISLHYWEGKSYEEIATIMDAPVGTVRSWLNRAKAKLREELS